MKAACRAALVLALAASQLIGCTGGSSSGAKRPGKSSQRAAAQQDVSLDFVGRDGIRRTLSRRQLSSQAPESVVEVYDPTYHKRKRYRAMPLVPVLRAGFGVDHAGLEKMQMLFEAADGYQSPVDGRRLYEGQPWLAVEDLDVAGWEAIPGHNGTKPGPLYVIWRQESGRDTKRFSWMWQLRAIKIASADLYAKAQPPQTASPAAKAGHRLFLRDCIRCHAINRQGGRLGPDLNVPRNVLSYRPKEQLRAFIKNPRAFRYGNMPAQTHLSEAALDQLLAYLAAMGTKQLDPGQ